MDDAKSEMVERNDRLVKQLREEVSHFYFSEKNKESSSPYFLVLFSTTVPTLVRYFTGGPLYAYITVRIFGGFR